MRVLISGAAGFVGANLVRRLLGEGHDVHALVRPGGSLWRLADIHQDVAIDAVDLRDGDATRRVVAAVRPDWVFHLAAYGAYSTQTDVEQMVGVNVAGTVHLLDAALERGFDAFLHAGSSSEYGPKNGAPAETELLEPMTPYGVTKAAATLYCRAKAVAHRAPICTLRLYSVYGPFEAPQRFIPAIVVKALVGELPPLVAPEVARDFVHVDDVVDAFVRAAAKAADVSGTCYNVGSGVQRTVGEVVALVQRLFDVRETPRWGSMPNRVWDTTVWAADPRRITEELSWSPRYDLDRGLRCFKEWFQVNPSLLNLYRAQQSN